MSYMLYGSKTSPFTRRIRILLGDIPHEFKVVDIYGADAKFLNSINPINQIPVLLDGDRTIWDSRMIFNYLNRTHRFQDMDEEEENLLTAVEGAMNSGILLFQLRRSGLDLKDPTMITSRQKERIESILDHLRPYIQGRALTSFDFQAMSLYSFLEWARFRDIVDLTGRVDCLKFLETHAGRQFVQNTQIPEA